MIVLFMAGVLIYKSAFQYYSFVAVDDGVYEATRADLSGNGNQVLWGRENVSVEQIDNAAETRHNLVAKLNEGQEVNLEEELAPFFEENQ